MTFGGVRNSGFELMKKSIPTPRFSKFKFQTSLMTFLNCHNEMIDFMLEDRKMLLKKTYWYFIRSSFPLKNN